MKFLEECGFLEEDIKEYEGNTPELVRKTINEHEALVKTNIDFLKNLGIKTYKEIFINYPDMFLMDASNFEKSFTQYNQEEMIEKLNANFKMVKWL
jgi:hypothetical protein